MGMPHDLQRGGPGKALRRSGRCGSPKDAMQNERPGLTDALYGDFHRVARPAMDIGIPSDAKR